MGEVITRLSPRKISIFTAFVIMLIALAYFASHGTGTPTGAFVLAKDVETSIDAKHFDKVFAELSPDTVKSGSNSSFTKRLSEKFADAKIDLVDVFKKDSNNAYAIYNISKDNKTELITIEFQKGKTWFITSFSDFAKCENECNVVDYPVCESNDHVLCKDTNNDGCTERVVTHCDVACTSYGCSNTPENFILKPYDTITAFPKRVQLLTIDEENKAATFDIGNNIYEIQKGSSEVIGNLQITLTGADYKLKKVGINIKQTRSTSPENNTT